MGRRSHVTGTRCRDAGTRGGNPLCGRRDRALPRWWRQSGEVVLTWMAEMIWRSWLGDKVLTVDALGQLPDWALTSCPPPAIAAPPQRCPKPRRLSAFRAPSPAATTPSGGLHSMEAYP
jgi:hypothetical protein